MNALRFFVFEDIKTLKKITKDTLFFELMNKKITSNAGDCYFLLRMFVTAGYLENYPGEKKPYLFNWDKIGQSLTDAGLDKNDN